MSKKRVDNAIKNLLPEESVDDTETAKDRAELCQKKVKKVLKTVEGLTRVEVFGILEVVKALVYDSVKRL